MQICRPLLSQAKRAKPTRGYPEVETHWIWPAMLLRPYCSNPIDSLTDRPYQCAAHRVATLRPHHKAQRTWLLTGVPAQQTTSLWGWYHSVCRSHLYVFYLSKHKPLKGSCTLNRQKDISSLTSTAQVAGPILCQIKHEEADPFVQTHNVFPCRASNVHIISASTL